MSEITGKEEKIIEKKSEDKQEIEDEERKKMIGGGEEVSRSEVEKKKKALEEAAEGTARRRAPIGGIRVPGFLRVSRSRDKNKDGDGDGEEGADLLEQPSSETKSPDEPTSQQQLPNIPIFSKLNITVPFIKKRKTPDEIVNHDEEKPPISEDQEEAPRRPKLINAIKLPLASIVPKKLKSTKESEDGGTQAGLASMETLDESNGSKVDEKQMELIRLENDLDPEKQALEDENKSKWSKKDWEKYWKFIKEYRIAVAAITVFVVVLIAVLFYVAFGPRPAPHAPIIDGKYISAVTSCGLVEGISENGIFVFRGIPYAKPPVGPLRFSLPQPLTLNECWNTTLKAHNSTPSCWQMFANGSIDGAEDCLSVDIYTPYVRYDSPIPVIVAVGIEELAIQPTIVRARDVVLIIPKIRQGPLGFTACHELTHDTYPKTSGNYGLADLIAALKWVKLNVEHFGGDSNEITVLGWRQGATLATVLTTIYKPKKLFTRLWLSSGSTIFPNLTLQESEKQSEEYIRGLVCPSAPSASCLRNLDVEDLLDAVPESWRPIARGTLPDKEEKRHSWLVQDGNIIREYLYNVWERQMEDKDFEPIPVVIGTTAHSEVNREWKEAHDKYTAEDVRKAIDNSLIGKMNYTDKVLAHYNSTVSGLAQIISDITTVCPLYFLHQKIPGAKFYLLKQTMSDDDLVYGGSDIFSVFGWAPSTRVTIRRSSTSLQHLFNQFVNLGAAPQYKATAIGEDEVHLRDGLPICQLWKKIGLLDYAWVD